jgi:twitching motility protein PilU
MLLTDFLRAVVEKRASDLFFTVGVPPTVKINGQLIRLNDDLMVESEIEALLFEVMTEAQKQEFVRERELNFAIDAEHLGRFRANLFFQRTHMGAVLRRIETEIPTVDQLALPKILNECALMKRGLILLVGATGAGKSSTLAAMIGHRNAQDSGHIISIEDPIEFVHQHQKCIITQREVGTDTQSFDIALKNTLRQAPDVILIGEIRTKETMQYAVTFAETGHLCLATLHANNANQALDRIAHFFPQELHRQLWMDLSLNLRAIIAQQLLPTVDGAGQVAAVEILLNTPIISEHIRKGEINVLKEFMSKSNEEGMQTFDQALFKLYTEKKISYESALKYADSENEVRLMIKLKEGKKPGSSLAGLSLLSDM